MELDLRARARLTTWLVDQRCLGSQCPKITPEIVESAKVGRSLHLHERATKLLRFIADQMETIATSAYIRMNNVEVYAWSESTEPGEVKALLAYLQREELLTFSEDLRFFTCRVTMKGYSHIDRVLLRLASPVEYAGDLTSHHYIFDRINRILWAEGLKIELDGPYPRITDSQAVEQENTHLANEAEAHQIPTPEVRDMDNKIFIVHGRDIGTKERVARFLDRIKLESMALQDMPSQGSTVIEKFERYASTIGFAVVLFTPDDMGSLSDDTGNVQPRAKQNVVFELGYFVGKLGRDRTCALVKGSLEMLSDYYGVLYIPLDDGDGWQMRLIQELKSAGYDIDANDAFIE